LAADPLTSEPMISIGMQLPSILGQTGRYNRQ
jgi:hypothetical protein